MQSDCEEPCPDFGGIELAADIAPAVGTETILASYAQGVVVLDHRGRVLARRAAFTNMGSADELLAIATGDLQPGRPVIAIATQAGGHREQEVWLELDQIGRNGALDVVFSAIVEVHDGRGDAVGAVTIVPGGILYRAPHAELAVLRKLD